MKRYFVYLICFVILSVVWMNCSEEQNPLPSKSHPEAWMKVQSTEFHGAKVNASGSESCKSCHGADFAGGESNVSCYQCHQSFPHPQGWLSPGLEQFHGAVLKKNDYNDNACKNCHGNDYQGGRSGVSCYKCHASYPHFGNWLNAENDDFHGEYIEEQDWSTASCQSCHGDNYQGGTSGVSCYTCHNSFPHQQGWLNPVNDDFHGQFIRVDNWSMRTCQSCHGTDYKGGESESSCYTCHTGQAGPEECNVCHGNPNNAAPPEDLSGNTETTVITVGAHQLHMNFLNDCTNCHMQPKALSDPGHIDQTPLAEVTKWEWDRTSATCNTFCHGDTTKAYIWNDFDN